MRDLQTSEVHAQKGNFPNSRSWPENEEFQFLVLENRDRCSNCIIFSKLKLEFDPQELGSKESSTRPVIENTQTGRERWRVGGV